MPSRQPDEAAPRTAREGDELALCRVRLTHIQRIAGLGSWEWQPEADTLWWSAEVFRIFGQEEDRCVPSCAAFFAGIHPDDREAVGAALRGALKQRLPLNIEFRIVRPDGRLCFVHTQGELTSFGAGRPTVMIGTLQDVTERRETENRLRLLKEAVECLPIGITITGVDGKILYTNPAEASIHGYTVAELLHREAGQLAPPSLQSPMSLEKIEKIGLWRRETLNVRKTGEVFPVQLSSVAVRNADGDFLGMITACEDITERKASEERIVQLAYHDTLTGLPNRWMFQDRLSQALAAAGRDGRQVGVMFLDLDHFKDVNDTLGHEFGDKLLRAVAQRLAASTREADTLARLGGDEFVVILTHLMDQQGVAAAVERIQAGFRKPFELEGRQIYSGASIGIAIYPKDGKDVASLLQSADMAMYHAKGLGRQTHHFYSREMNQSVRRKVALENGLRRALEREEFHLVFQPQWDLPSGTLIGLEALLRWDSADFGPIPPASFIPLAENSGLIYLIGEWVLRSACTQVAAWLAAGHAVPRVAVNISGHQFKRPDFLAVVDAILRETGTPPQHLELEFTESVLMEEAGRSADILRALKGRRIHLSIDDFGTGYSSLSCLRHFPIDRIKIDRSFVADLAGNPDGSSLVEAIIAMGRSLGLKVMAEGVENREQFEFLTLRGCDEAQGFFFARPLPAEALTAALVDGRLSQPAGAADEMPGGESANGDSANCRP
ncbi:MAG TPA: EAL domain-containing protein [Desulfuromonadales bacterium]|nr:EAL domain-containing protein [Desulfuromonadales bacterium]